MISWNTNGDLIGVASRKNINIFDPRNENLVLESLTLFKGSNFMNEI